MLTQNYSVFDEGQYYGRKRLGRRYGTNNLPTRSRHKKNKKKLEEKKN